MTRLKLAASAAVSAATLTLASLAQAATLDFSYSGLDAYGDDGSFNFTMDSTPTPFLTEGDDSTTFLVTGDFNGQSRAFYVTFNSTNFNGGFEAVALTPTNDIDDEFEGEGLYSPDGTFQVYFTGSTAAPVFTPGSFGAYIVAPIANSDVFNQQRVGTFTISGVATSAAPEPAAWALSTVGFGVAGAALRRRRASAARGVAI